MAAYERGPLGANCGHWLPSRNQAFAAVPNGRFRSRSPRGGVVLPRHDGANDMGAGTGIDQDPGCARVAGRDIRQAKIFDALETTIAQQS
jgi:hypothetical protein